MSNSRFVAQAMAASRTAAGKYDPALFSAHLIRAARASDPGEDAFNAALDRLNRVFDDLRPLPGITVTTASVLEFQGHVDAAFAVALEQDIAARKEKIDVFFSAVTPAIGMLAAGAPPAAIAAAVLPAAASLLIGLAGSDNVDLSALGGITDLLKT